MAQTDFIIKQYVCKHTYTHMHVLVTFIQQKAQEAPKIKCKYIAFYERKEGKEVKIWGYARRITHSTRLEAVKI